jgi:xylulokinase
MPAFLGIDVGTSGVKTIIVDEDDRELASAGAPLEVQRPRPLWSEQDPDAWWDATAATLDRLAADRPDLMARVEALGLSGQMLGVTLLDAGDRPIRPALLWNDGRAGAECAELERRIPDFTERVGCRAMPGFCAPKILWLARHEPDAIARTRRILLAKDYVRLRLSGEAVSDLADASATLLMDTLAGTWSAELAAASGITTDVLPRLVASGAVSAALRPDLARRWRLTPGLPIAGGAGDNMCGAVGAGVVHKGDAFISLGTSGVYFVSDDHFATARAKGMHTHRHAIPGLFARHGVVLSAASALTWIAGVVGAASVERFIADIESADLRADEIPVFSPYLAGERTPHDDPVATATLSNLRSGTGALHIGQAVLEGVAFALADCQDALIEAGAPIERVALIGGGARSRLWAEIIATVLGRPLRLPRDAAFGPALGAARLARQSIGGDLGKDLSSAAAVTVEPRPDVYPGLDMRRKCYHGHYRQVERNQTTVRRAE